VSFQIKCNGPDGGRTAPQDQHPGWYHLKMPSMVAQFGVADADFHDVECLRQWVEVERESKVDLRRSIIREMK
jgi:hypothetical protein